MRRLEGMGKVERRNMGLCDGEAAYGNDALGEGMGIEWFGWVLFCWVVICQAGRVR